MKVSAIITTYNRLPILKECLNRLVSQSYKLNSIVVVNNNSTDGTKEYLDTLDNSRIKAINTSKNLGGAGGFSLGTKFAYEYSNSNYFWIMDDDTLVSKSSLFNLIKQIKKLHDNFGFLCSNVRWWKDGKSSLTNIPQPAKDWNSPLITNLVKVQSTSFVSVIFRRDSVSKLGLPISDMFIWGDDLEFTNRLSDYNDRCFLVMNSIVYHKSKKNVSYNIINSPRIKYYKYGIRNKIYVKRKYDNIIHLIKQLLSYFSIFIRIPFNSKDKRLLRMYCVVIGIIEGFIFNPKIKFPK